MQHTDRFAEARARMVDGQVRPNRVTDAAIVAAMRSLPRERFVPPGLAAVAYADQEIPLGGGRSMLRPNAIARLVQLGRPEPGMRALVLGANTGYGAALLAACGAQVVALEADASLLAIAREACPPGLALVAAAPELGWSEGAPYGLILIEGGAHAVPDAVAAQLAPAGRIVFVRLGAGPGVATVARRSGAGLALTPGFDVAASALPGFPKAAAFRL